MTLPLDEISLAAGLSAGRFAALPVKCGNESVPGVDESPRNRDWSHRPTTHDQTRIEEFLQSRIGRKNCILHVGIGNSRLAQRFSHQVAKIDGLTISQAEIGHAEAMRLPGYEVRRANKYSRGFTKTIGSFDFIIDNNPTTFACCLQHFSRMMLTYRALLAPGGLIVSDLQGLRHLASDEPELKRWRFDEADWREVAARLDLAAQRHGEFILTMQAPGESGAWDGSP